MDRAPALHTSLPLKLKVCYGVGHVLNDLCASMWFSYLLIYFHSVITFSNVMAGNLMLIGQVSDALCTPFVGIESDRTQGICGYGKRKSWHLIGTICVASSFSFLFTECLVCDSHTTDFAKFIYYSPFVIIFQFGWASTQISHLSLIPELTPHEDERVFLNSIRYAFTVISNLMVFTITWLFLEYNGQHATRAKTDVICNGTCPYTSPVPEPASRDEDDLSQKDAPSFRIISFIVIAIGLVFSLVFHAGTPEKTKSKSAKEKTVDEEERLISCSGLEEAKKIDMKWSCWLKLSQFYIIALLYMATRLVVNVSQVYIPFYLTDTLDLRKQTIAYVPLAGYVVGLLASFVVKGLNNKVGRKITYAIGIFIVLGCSAYIYFIKDNEKYNLGYALSIGALIGAGGSVILITCLTMVSDLVASNTESGAFVYGAMSFTDKGSETCCAACGPYYKDVMTFVPGSVAVFAFILLLILIPQKIGHRPRNQTVRTHSVSSESSINNSDQGPKHLSNCAKSTDWNNEDLPSYTT